MVQRVYVHGRRRSEGKLENGTPYSGWKCGISMPSDNPDYEGDEVKEVFLSDKYLEGVVPSKGDELDIYKSFDGKIVKIKPVIAPKGNNYSANNGTASK